MESTNIWVKALVIANYCEKHSHYNADKSLAQWLVDNKIPALTGIDTRRLTKELRTKRNCGADPFFCTKSGITNCNMTRAKTAYTRKFNNPDNICIMNTKIITSAFFYLVT